MRVPVVAPPATPPTYGIVRSANIVTEPDERWVRGITWNPEACGPSGTSDPCVASSRDAAANDRPANVDFMPYLVWASDICSTFGQRDGRDARAVRRLLACESKQIEKELWRGDQARVSGHDNLRLAATDLVTVISAVPVHAVDALGQIEDGLASTCGGVGMIHATPRTVSLWSAHHLVERQANGLIVTVLGTIVVPGQGYDGSAPAADGVAPVAPAVGTAWAYGTERVDLRRGPIVTTGADPDQFDRRLNNIEVRSERAAAAVFDPCSHVGINVDITF